MVWPIFWNSDVEVAGNTKSGALKFIRIMNPLKDFVIARIPKVVSLEYNESMSLCCALQFKEHIRSIYI